MIYYTLLIIAYILCGIGYYRSCQNDATNIIDEHMLKPKEQFFFKFLIISFWLILLFIIGFAYVLSKIEYKITGKYKQ